MNLEQLLDALHLGEGKDYEFKSAAGGFPKSAWESVSAFANTEGGTIILGVVERSEGLVVEGVQNPDVLLKTFWDTHNNSSKLNHPVCIDSDVTVLELDSCTVICIDVPQASRQMRPVYINGNPLLGSYKRNYEGDYRCSEAEVRQMLRDASDEAPDSRILEGFSLRDLDRDTLAAYRNRFSSRDPDHPFLALDDQAFLESLGAWRRDRRSQQDGVTLAGLLMFGTERSLLEALPHFHLDYQEQLSSDPEQRWTYRLTIDGKWAPNLFNFYYRVFPRLSDGVDVPFKLDHTATRLESTHVHEALREALVNMLVHADHQSSRPLTVIKRKDVFIFANPGRLRIPLDQLYLGGVSDPRNPSLLKLFQMLGLGEKAGSGFQKILRAWREQPWQMPLVADNPTLEMTRIGLPIASMIPEQVEQELKAVVGDAYQGLDELDRVILMTAHRFGEVGNEDIQQYRSEHPRIIGERLAALVDAKWLDKAGQGRGTRYRWPAVPDLLFAADEVDLDSEHLANGSEHLSADSEHLADDSEHLTVDDRLKQIAAPARASHKIPKSQMNEIVLALCETDWLSLRELATMLDRKPDSLRNHYINPLLSAGLLEAKVPGKRNSSQQAYRRKAQ